MARVLADDRVKDIELRVKGLRTRGDRGIYVVAVVATVAAIVFEVGDGGRCSDSTSCNGKQGG